MIVLARHGETPYNAARRFQGHLPVPLNDRGREQAHALARAAAEREWAVLWTSPLARARETAGIVAAATGLEPHEDARLAETDCGDWTDRFFDDVEAEDPEGFAAYARADAGFQFPGGESFVQQTRRVMAALHDIGRGPGPALVVCHRQVIRLALVETTGDQAQRGAVVDNAALIELPGS
jgi:broad specificity phosphatase PhoE